MEFDQIVLSIVLPIFVGLGGYLIGAVANRRLVKANAADKVSSSYSKLVDDLQEQCNSSANKIVRLETKIINLNVALNTIKSDYNIRLEELSSKYTSMLEEHATLRLQYAELKQEYAEHRERSKVRLESSQRITETRTEAMEAKINQYRQTITLQDTRIRLLEQSMNGGQTDEVLDQK